MFLRIRIALVFVLFASSVAAQSVSFKPHRFESGDGKSVDAEMGELTVPENRAKRGWRTITLRFVRFKSTAAKPGNPIVYLAGGPGGSGIGAATGARFPLFMALREHGDVIAWDMRGVNQSEPKMGCDQQYLVAPGEPLDRAKAGAEIARAVRKCVDDLRASGVDVSAYNNREAAADLEDLRKALGAPKLILWGISYGTHLAIAAMRFHPELVERAILAGIEGPDDTYKLPSDQQTLIEEIARLAAQDAGIRSRIPDLLASIGGVLHELETSPKSVPLTDPSSGRSATFVVGKLDFQAALAGMLTAPENFAGLPDFVSRLEHGDWTALALSAAGNRIGRAPSVMSVAMDCSSGITEERKRIIAAEAKRTLLGDAINIPFPEICAAVDMEDLGDAYRGQLVTDIPALLISGTLDGRTRPRQAEELRRTMPRAQHVIIEGAGHSDPLFLSSPKILEAMHAFLRGETIVERVIVLPPIRFSPVRVVVRVADDVLARYAGTYAAGKQKLRVVQAGSVLYVNASGRALALRPISATEFFSDSFASTFRFEIDAKGKAAALLFELGGQEVRATRE